MSPFQIGRRPRAAAAAKAAREGGKPAGAGGSVPGCTQGEKRPRARRPGRAPQMGHGRVPGREAAHAQRVTGQPGFAKGEMGGASRTRAGAASVGPETSAANFGREAAHAQRVTGQPGFAKGEMGGASRTRAGAASVGPKMSAANFGREAAHAQRVTGQPGFAKGEMGGASRTRAGAASAGLRPAGKPRRHGRAQGRKACLWRGLRQRRVRGHKACRRGARLSKPRAGCMEKAHWGAAAPLASIETHFVTKCNTKKKIFKN